MTIWKILSGLLGFLLIAAIITAVVDHNKLIKLATQHEKEIQAVFRKKELEYNQALQDSEDRRKTLERTRDSLIVSYGALDRLDEQHRIELTKIKGKYDKLTSTELGQEMVKQFNERKPE